MLFREAKRKLYRFIRTHAFLEGVRDSLGTAKSILYCMEQESMLGDFSVVELEIKQDEYFSRRYDITITEIGGWKIHREFTVWFDHETFESGPPGGVSYVTVDNLDRTFNTEKFVAFIALESEREIFKRNRYYLGNMYEKVAFVDDVKAYCRP